MKHVCAALSFALLVQGSLALAQDQNSLKKEIASLKEQIGVMQEDVTKIRQDVDVIMRIFQKTAQSRDPQAPVSLESDKSSEADFYLGKPDAPLTIMAFIDYQCGFCAQFFESVFPDLKRDFIDSGKLKFIFRDFPLPMHNMAQSGALHANCAREQGKYMQMHDALYKDAEQLSDGAFEAIYADLPGLDQKKLKLCLKSEAQIEKIKADLEEGDRLGVSATPSFFLTKTAPAGEKMEGFLVRGSQPYQIFKDALNGLLQP